YLALDGARDVDAPQLLHGAIELRELGQALFEGRPLHVRIGDEARIERAREDDAPLAGRLEHVAIARRDARAPLRVDRVLVTPAEHRRALSSPLRDRGLALLATISHVHRRRYGGSPRVSIFLGTYRRAELHLRAGVERGPSSVDPRRAAPNR